MRKLAEKTMSSTQDVGNAISVIQESTAKSMEAMDNAVSRISDATELANQSGAALREIVSTADDTFDRIQAIATASEEQSAASEEINRSIITVNDMSRQTASSMTEAAKAVADLAAQAQSLTGLIQEMKKGITDSGHPTAGNRKRCAPSGSTPFSAWPRRAQAVNKKKLLCTSSYILSFPFAQCEKNKADYWISTPSETRILLRLSDSSLPTISPYLTTSTTHSVDLFNFFKKF